MIDADKMLKRIESWNTSDAMDKALYNFTLNRIIEQPTVDAVPVRHGRWLNKRYGVKFDGHSYPFRTIGTCSECHETSCDAGDYCPNCGAKMDGKGEE